MTRWLRRIRGALGMGLIWGAAWGIAGNIVVLGFLLKTGSRPDAPFPIVSGAFGFVAGIVVSVVLSLVEGRRPLGQMSLPRFAMWGAIGGLLLSTTFVLAVSLGGDPAFLWNLVVVGPILAVAAAGSAAGSLALARRVHHQALPAATDDVTAMRRAEGDVHESPRDGG